MWQLDSMRDDSLPRLAWCALLVKHRLLAIVQHGPWVEVSPAAFVEGAWSGRYGDMSFATASTFTGSGGLCTPSGLILATPTHSVEPLYILRTGSGLHCSNSLSFALASANDDIDYSYRYYDVDITSMAFGLKRYSSRIPTRDHNWVSIYYYHNILIDTDLSITLLPKHQRGPFLSYSDYRSFLDEQVSITIQNAADPQRTIRYAPLLTVSTGYDSAAAAVVARATGCREAMTFTTARDASGGESDDSGKDLGELLGLEVTEYDPIAYRTRLDLPEAEFAATGGGGGSVILSTVEARLPAKILLTGHYGAEAWERINNKGGEDMVTQDSAGADMIYFRTRVGFAHLPVPSIGYYQYRSIQEITRSAAMRPWSLERNQYDRPIPRRIIEEAGVPREMFGQSKNAAARSLKYCDAYSVMEPDLARVMTPASYQHFQHWIQGIELYQGRLDQLNFAFMHALYHRNLRVIQNRRVRAVAHRLGISVPSVPFLPIRYRKRRTPHRLLFHWGMEQLKPHYTGRRRRPSPSVLSV